MENENPNYTLLALANIEASVWEAAVRPAPGKRSQTLVRLANLYGVSVLQDGVRLEVAVVSWNSPEDTLDDWAFVDENNTQEGIYQSQNWQTVTELKEQLITLQLLPSLMGGS